MPLPNQFKWGERKRTHSFMLTPFTIDLLKSIAARTKTSRAHAIEVWARTLGRNEGFHEEKS